MFYYLSAALIVQVESICVHAVVVLVPVQDVGGKEDECQRISASEQEDREPSSRALCCCQCQLCALFFSLLR